MTIRTRIILLVLMVTGGIALSIVTVQNNLLREHLIAGQKEWVETLVRAVAEGVASNTIDGDKLQARSQLVRIVSEDVALEYIYVTDFEGGLFVHTFDGGFPKTIAERLHASDTEEEVVYSTEHGDVEDIAWPLIEGMDAHLHIGVNQREVEVLVAAAQKNLIRIVGLVTVIGLTISVFVGARMGRPLTSLTEQIERYAEVGKGDEVVVETTEPHIKKLVSAFNQMVRERSLAEESLRRSQKMEAVGKLTGGIAHDFNNMLGVVMGYLELIAMNPNLDDKVKERLQSASNAAKHSAELTKKLLGFSGTQAHGTKLVCVNDSIASQEELIAKSLTVTIKVENHLATDLWHTNIDKAEFDDALLNMIINARDAMPDGGTLTIETANKVIDDDYMHQNPGSLPGDFVMVSVSDTGVGMLREIQERVFEPFFSTKEEGKGTGLGLSMVYGFVKRAGGHIKIYSEPGKGTTFRIFLPRADNETQGQIYDAATEREIPGGTETVLVVDDEEALVDIAASKLEQLGYLVVTAFNGQQAMDVMTGNPDIDLLFSDIIMPGRLDGYQLALAARGLRPSLKILLTSGFSNKHEGLRNVDAVMLSKLIKSLLSKPYSHAELAFAVRLALDE